ncbi:hypothetical protein EXIGLDRAFT_725673 [Exidia glandulosa HHB12029]|uniref:B box-type domain-containing protein n=1 Tax=Exidia glandulosa HHB12029 TaxID=1314781 RepID=A0A165Q7V5_EXIGL|nr:hypothetical protein EXIGLDRAFT_725673 [Exidia glandulosa HHB12029]
MPRRTRSSRAGADHGQPAAASAVAVDAEFSPHKRRRVAGSSSSGGRTAAQRVTPPVTRSATSSGALNATLVCASCHRRPPRMDELVSCPRCETTVCAVCTRTCTSSAPPSLPPTPQLSYSATPVGSPQRAVLPLALEQLSELALPKQKRRRAASDMERDEAPQLGMVGVVGGDGVWTEDFMLGEGCGRVVCKECAVEHQEE